MSDNDDREYQKAREWLLEDKFVQEEEKGPPAGAFGYSIGGGPSFSDGYRFRRGPSPIDLIEQFKSIVYACCWVNANGVARIPLRLYTVRRKGMRKTLSWNEPRPVPVHRKRYFSEIPYVAKQIAGAESIEEITQHPLLDTIQWVCDDMDYNQLLQYTSICFDLFGTAFWWPFRGKLNVPKEIWTLPPQYVLPIMATASMVPEFYQFGGVAYDKDELLKFKWVAPKNPYALGMGAAQASIEYARLEDVFVSLQDNLLSNGPRPTMLISHRDPKGSFGPQERKRLEYDMEMRGRGGKAGGVFVVDGAAEVKTLAFTPTDLAGLQVANYNLERICNDFGVPPTFFSKDTNLANSQTATEHHARNAIEPRCKNIASTLTRWTHSLYGPQVDSGYDSLFWAFDQATQHDRKGEAEIQKSLFSMGLTVNNILMEHGYEPVEDGDVSLVSNQLVPLTFLVNQTPEAPVAPSVRTNPDKPQTVGSDSVGEKPKPKKPATPAKPKPKPKPTKPAAAAKPKKPTKPKWFKNLPAAKGVVGSVPTHREILDDALNDLAYKDRFYDSKLTGKQHINVLHQIRLNGCAWLRREAANLIVETSGKALGAGVGAKIDKFFKRVNSYLRELILAGSLAVGGPKPLTQSELRSVEENHAVQIAYLDGFQEALTEEVLSLGGTFVARAEMYGACVWAAAQNVALDAAKDEGIVTEVLRVHVGQDVPCDDCIAEVERGWHPIEDSVPIGDTQCMNYCHCHFVFRTAAHPAGIVVGRED